MHAGLKFTIVLYFHFYIWAYYEIYEPYLLFKVELQNHQIPKVYFKGASQLQLLYAPPSLPDTVNTLTLNFL